MDRIPVYVPYNITSFYTMSFNFSNPPLTTLKEKMKTRWFKRTGIFFIPVTLSGWLILLAAAGYAVYIFMKIDRESHSVSDTLRPFILYFLFISAVYSVIAFLPTITIRKYASNRFHNTSW